MEAIHICFSIMYIVNEFKEIIHKIEISGNRTAIWQSFAGPAGNPGNVLMQKTKKMIMIMMLMC